MRVVLAEMAIVIEDRQMREIISFSLNMTNFMKLGKYSHLRPKCSISEDKLAWFRYAISRAFIHFVVNLTQPFHAIRYAGNVVLSQVKARRRRTFTRGRFNQRIEDKLVYIELWKSKLMTSANALQRLPQADADLSGFTRSSLLYRQVLSTARYKRRTDQVIELANGNNNHHNQQTTLNEDTIRLLHFLEKELDFQDLLYFRSIAEKAFSAEEGSKATWVGSLLSWASGGKAANTEEDRRKLYDALKFDPDSLYKGGSKEMDMNEVNFIANVVLKEGSVTLALSAPESTTTFQQAVPFFKIKFTELKQKAVLMGGGAHVKVFVSLQDFEGFELLPNVIKRKKAPDTISHHIIHRRNLKADQMEIREHSNTINSETESNLSFSEDKSVSSATKSRLGGVDTTLPPLFSSTIEIFPPGHEVEVSVNLDVEEMEVWISPDAKWINSIAAFSSWPEEQQYWSEMEMQALNQLADLKSRFDAKVAYMMDNHSSVKIEGKIQAPVLVIHDNRYSFGTGKADMLVVDLGTIFLMTEKLAKVERQKQEETKISQFQPLASTSLLPGSILPRLSENDAQKDSPAILAGVAGANTGGIAVGDASERNWQMLENDLDDFHDANDMDYDSISKQLPFTDNFGFDQPGHKSNRRSSGLKLPLWKPTRVEDKDDASSLHELFDIFQVRVSKIEVYFIEISQSDIREYGHGLWNNALDLQKTVLIPGFEIYSEIQVSVLPWDPTIPPFKVYSSISEINVQLSDAKIMRLLNFGNEIAKGSANLRKKTSKKAGNDKSASVENKTGTGTTSANATGAPQSAQKSISHFRFLQNAKKVESISSNNVQTTVQATALPSSTATKKSTSKRRRRARSYGDTIATGFHSRVSAESYRETRSQRSSVFDGVSMAGSRLSKRASNKRVMGGLSAELEYQASHVDSVADDDDYDSDEGSFFSFDNNYDQEEKDRALEDLQYQMNQRETMRAKLIQEIRLAENDPSKANVYENLKAELIECEMNLHQLKVSYVELLVENDEEKHLHEEEDATAIEGQKDQLKDRFDMLFTPAKVDDSEHGGGNTTKRDFTHAKENMIPEEAPVEMTFNKELVFLQMALGVMNIDFEIPRHPQHPFQRTYRFSISGLGSKVRHRVQDTKVSMYLRDTVLSEVLASPDINSNGGPLQTVPILTSDPSIFSTFAVPFHIRPNTLNSSSDLLYVRYSISYGQKAEKNSDVHQAQINVGYIGFNLRWQKLTPLIEEFMRIGHLIESKQAANASMTMSTGAGTGASTGISADTSMPTPASPSRRSSAKLVDQQDVQMDVPKLLIALKVDCVSLTIIQDNAALLNTTMTSLSVKVDTLYRRHFSVKLVDFSAYDLLNKMDGRNEKYSRSALYSIGSSNVVLGKNILDDHLFLHVQSDSFDTVRGGGLNLDMHVKLASVVAVSDGPLVIALSQLAASIDRDVKALQAMYPIAPSVKPQSPTEAASTPVSSPALPSLLVSAKATCMGILVHVPTISPVDGKTTTLTLTVGKIGSSFFLRNESGDSAPHLDASLSVEGIGAMVQFRQLLNPFSCTTSLSHRPMAPPNSSPLPVSMVDSTFTVQGVPLEEEFSHLQSNSKPFVDIHCDVSKLVLVVTPDACGSLLGWGTGITALAASVNNVLNTKSTIDKPAITLVQHGVNANERLAGPVINLSAHMTMAGAEVLVVKDASTVSLRAVVEDIQVNVKTMQQNSLCGEFSVRRLAVCGASQSSSSPSRLLASETCTLHSSSAVDEDHNSFLHAHVTFLPEEAVCNVVASLGGIYSVLTPAEIVNAIDLGKVYADVLTNSVNSASVSKAVIGTPFSGTHDTMRQDSHGNRNAMARGQPTAYPSSVPMQPAESRSPGAQDMAKDSSTPQKLLTVVDFRSLFRSIPVALQVDFYVHGVDVYLPVDPEGKSLAPEILKLGLSASLLMNLPRYPDLGFDQSDISTLPLLRIDRHDASVSILLLKENIFDHTKTNTVLSEDENVDFASCTESSQNYPWERVLQQTIEHGPSTSAHILLDLEAHGRTILAISSRVSTDVRGPDADFVYCEQDIHLAHDIPRRSLQMASELEIGKLDVKLFADYRSFLTLNEQVVAPLVAKLSALDLPSDPSTPSSSAQPGSPLLDANGGSDSSVTIKTVGSVPEILGSLPDICSVKFVVKIPSVQISIWNDIIIHPIFFGQVCVNDIEVSGVYRPLVDFYNVRLIRVASLQSSASINGLSAISDEQAMERSRYALFSDPTVLDLFQGVQELVPHEHARRAVLDNLFQTLSVKVDGQLSISYQNQRLLAVEPLIEPTKLQIRFTQLFREDQNSAICVFVANELASTYHERKINGLLQRFARDNFLVAADDVPAPLPIPPNLEVVLDEMNFNITTPLILSLFTLVKSLSTVESHSVRDTSRAEKWESSMVLIRNEVGLPIKYWSNLDQGENVGRILLSGEEIGWSTSDDFSPGPKKLSMAVEKPDGTYWSEIRDISFDGTGCRAVSLGGASSQNSSSDKKRAFKFPDSNSSPVVILELSAKVGRKILVVRSSVRVFNATKSTIFVQFLQSIPSNPSVAWELKLPPSKGSFVPANICNRDVNGVLVTTNRILENHSSNDVSNYVGAFPCPDYVRYDSRGRASRFDSTLGSQNHESTGDQVGQVITHPTNNGRKRRHQFSQQKGMPNLTSYFHWINLHENEEPLRLQQQYDEVEHGLRKMHRSGFINAHIEARDDSGKKSQSTEASMLRTIKFLAPVTVINLMAKRIVVALYPDFSSSKSLHETQNDPDLTRIMETEMLPRLPHIALEPGEAGESMSLHASEGFKLALKLSDEDHHTANSQWSSFVNIPGCVDGSTPVLSDTLSVDIDFKNGSRLSVLLEIVDNGGCRTVNIYTPYWIVPSSFIPLQVQHDARQVGRTTAQELSLNGCDQLAADQAYAEKKDKKTAHLTLRNRTTDKQREFLQAMARAKGMNGIILGPDIPMRGLADAFRPLSKNDLTVRRMGLGPKKHSSTSKDDQNNQSLRPSERDLTRVASQMTVMTNADFPRHGMSSSDHRPAHVIHCSYSNREKKACHLKLRNRNTLWSDTLSVSADFIGIKYMRLQCASQKPIDDFDGNDTMNSPFVKEGKKYLELGVNVQTLEPPFQRTKIVYVVDRYTAINLVGQTIEIKQSRQENMITLRPNEESTLWFRPPESTPWFRSDEYVYQIRLARYGWSWSGAFSITKDGEIPVRLRNDYDNTVFFILVYVHRSGPVMKIVFKGGDKYSPYRFENHSMETFKIKQRGQALYTNLLPYHCCAYAWDEPLAANSFVLCIQKPGQQVQDEWQEVGDFSFDRIEALAHNGPEYLAMQIITQGPTRVLQIRDTRIYSSATSLLRVPSQFTASSDRKKSLLSTTSLTDFTLFRLSLSINLIGLSIIDQIPQEVLYISLSNIAVEQLLARSQHTVNLSVGRLQIDNQLLSTPYPSLLHPLRDMTAGGWSPNAYARKNPSLALHLQQSFEYDGVAFFPSFKVDIAPFDVNIEMNVVAAIINLANYAKEEYQETMVMSRHQVFDIGSSNSSKVSVYDLNDALAASPIAMGLMQSNELSRSQLFFIDYLINKQYQQHDQQPHKHRSAGQAQHGWYKPSNDDDSQGYDEPPAPSASYQYAQETTLASYFIDKMAAQTHNIDDAIRTRSKVYFQHFEIGKISVNISLNPTMSKESNFFKANSLIFGAFSAVILAIGSTFASIDNCPLRFPVVAVDHMFANSSGFANKIIDTYQIEAVKQSYLLLFSSQMLGNPVQLLQTVGEGLWDFVYLPAAGLSTSPQAFALGIVQGSLSLFRTVVASLCTTTGNLATSLQSGLITLGAVDAYAHQQQQQQHQPPDSTRPQLLTPDAHANGATNSQRGSYRATGQFETAQQTQPSWSQSVTDSAQQRLVRPKGVFDAVRMGIAGLWLDPIYGFQQDGMNGLAIGVVKGSIGLLARPLYGTLGFTASTLEQLSLLLLPRYLAHQKHRLIRVRPPRFFKSPNLPLQVYSAEEHVGQELLSRVEQGLYRSDGYLWHGRVDGDDHRILLLTKQRLLLLEDHWQYTSVIWQCLTRDLESIEVGYQDSVPTGTVPDRSGYYTQQPHQQAMRNAEVILELINGDLVNVQRSGNHINNTNNNSSNSISSSYNKQPSQPYTFRSQLQGTPSLSFYYAPIVESAPRYVPSHDRNMLFFVHYCCYLWLLTLLLLFFFVTDIFGLVSFILHERNCIVLISFHFVEV